MNVVRRKKAENGNLSSRCHRSIHLMKGCDTETHPQVFDLFVLFQFLKEGLEKVGPLDVAWSHTQGVNVSTWKTRGHVTHRRHRHWLMLLKSNGGHGLQW